MSRKKILILGGGLAGLSAAWHLQRKGRECAVFEKEPEAGGLCRSKQVGGFTFDYSGHLLHFRHQETLRLVKGLLGHNLREHKRSAWVYARKRYIPYPFQANLHGLPLAVVKDCLLGLVEAGKNGTQGSGAEHDISFLEWIHRTFGRGIARHFMVPYNSKFWTVHPRRMSCEWLDGFVPVPSLSQIIEGTMEHRLREYGYNSHFWYPLKGGIHAFPRALAAEVKNIHTGLGITQIDCARKRVRLSSGEDESYDRLISTIPLPEMARLIRHMPAAVKKACGRLRWNSILNVNLGLGSASGEKRHWVYFPESSYSFFRIGFYHNFSSGTVPPGKGGLYVELSRPGRLAENPAHTQARISGDLKKTGNLLGAGGVCCRDSNDIRYGYPIYDMHYKTARGAVVEFLARQDILACGRYGAWRYFSMEDSFRDGQRVACLC